MSSDVKVKAVFLFNLSKAGLNQELIQTGQRGGVGRKVEVPFAELSPDDRALVVECGRDLGAFIEVSLQNVALNSDVYATRVEDESAWIKATTVELDAVPTISEAVALARQLRDRGKSVREHAKAKVAEAKATAAEQRRRNLAAYEELHNKLYHPGLGLIATRNLPALKGWSWADSTGHLLDGGFAPDAHESDKMTLYAPARLLRYKGAGSVVDDAIKELEKAAAEAEKDSWIRQYGSAHLKEAWLADYPSSREYLVERAAKEFPGFTLDFDGNGGDTSRSFPSRKALAAEKYLQSLGVSCRVVWVTQWPFDKRDEVIEDNDACEAIRISDWYGKDLYAKPADINLNLSRPYGTSVYQQ